MSPRTPGRVAYSLLAYLSITVVVLMMIQIEFWRVGRPDETRSSDIIVRHWQPCRPLDSKAERAAAYVGAKTVAKPHEAEMKAESRGRGEKVTGVASGLWPYTSIAAVVRVMNGAHRGPPSAPIVFNTSEGGQCFSIDYRLSLHDRHASAMDNIRINPIY